MEGAFAHLKTQKPVEVEFYRISEGLSSTDGLEQTTAAQHTMTMMVAATMGCHLQRNFDLAGDVILLLG